MAPGIGVSVLRPMLTRKLMRLNYHHNILFRCAHNFSLVSFERTSNMTL